MLTKNKGGSNLLSFDYTNPDAGLITQYNDLKYKAQIDDLLSKMRDNGQDCVQLLFLVNQSPPSGIYVPFTGFSVPALYQDNFANLLDTIQAKGFKFVGVVPEFWGVDDFRLNDLSDAQIYNHLAFLQWIDSCLDIYNFDYCLDLCAELDPSPRCVYNAKLLWTWWTAAHFPNAAPCWDATMSLIPQSDYSFVRDIFKGTDSNGAPNWPARINLHAYRNEIPAMLDGLEKVGMPIRNIYVGECFTLADDGSEDIYASNMHQVILDEKDKYVFERIIQYPIKVNQIEAPEVDILPIGFRY